MSTATNTVDFDASYQLSIDGQLVNSDDTFEVYNPATGEVLAQAPAGTPEHIEQAVAAARGGVPRMVGAELEGTFGMHQPVRRRPGGAEGGLGPAADPRAGQAAAHDGHQ